MRKKINKPHDDDTHHQDLNGDFNKGGIAIVLIALVIAYLLLTIGIGLYASLRVQNAKDFLVAGRSLPLYITIATVFATWFGAETVLSVSATFTKDGLKGIPGDPFAASISLFLVAIFFAKAFYRMDLMTIGDFYKKRYGKLIEVITSIVIVISYLGWTSAQMTALGLVISVLSGDLISLNTAIILGSLVVIIYTFFGGMWSVALTDMLQAVLIIIGLIFVAYLIGEMAGGPSVVIEHAKNAGKFQMFPDRGSADWGPFIGSFITVCLGTIPQQDVFQRVTSAKDEKTAVWGTIIGASIYFIAAFIPMFIAYAALVIDPNYLSLFANEDTRIVQKILPDLVLNRTPLWAQALFFGALLSAILSTASGALLAPTALFTENVLKPFNPAMNDKQMMVSLRVVLILFSIAALLFALQSNSTMYEMVQNAYNVTLVGALVPLVAGLVWPKASLQGALFSVVLGISVWIPLEYVGNSIPQLWGLLVSAIGMLVGSVIPQWITPPPEVKFHHHHEGMHVAHHTHHETRHPHNDENHSN
jgi:SSS family solute:Na+ symporter